MQLEKLRIVIRHAISAGSLSHDPAPGINGPQLHRIQS